MLPIIGALATMFTSALTYITAVASKAIPLIAQAAKQLIVSLGKNLPVVIDIIETITDILSIIDKNKVDSEEIGKRALESEKIPEDFDDIEAYIRHLQEEITVEEKEHSDFEKFAHKALGGSILIKGIEEKLNTNTNHEFWKEAVRNKLKGSEIIAILEKYSSKNIDLDFDKYCKGELNHRKESERGNMLVEVFSELDPERNIEEIEDRIMDMEKNSQNKREIEEYDG